MKIKNIIFKFVKSMPKIIKIRENFGKNIALNVCNLCIK